MRTSLLPRRVPEKGIVQVLLPPLHTYLFQASNLTSNTDGPLFPSHAFEFVPDIKGEGNEKKKSGSV